MTAAAASLRPLDLHRLVDRAPWATSVKALGHALIGVVNNETLSWPLRASDPGLTVARLGALVGAGRSGDGICARHVRRLLAVLEAEGVLEVVRRPWATNLYRLVVGGWQRLAARVFGPSPSLPTDRAPTPPLPPLGARSVSPASPSPAGGSSPRGPSPSLAPSAASFESPAPRWAVEAARREGVDPAAVAAVVSGAVTSITGRPTGAGGLVNQVVLLWRSDGRSASEFSAAVDAVAVAARDCRGWAPELLRGGRDRRRDPAHLLRTRNWAQALERAEAHAEGRCGCRPARAPAPARPGWDALSEADRERAREAARHALAGLVGVMEPAELASLVEATARSSV